MTKTEKIIRSILGTVRMNVRPLACAIALTSQLLFVQKLPMDEIFVTKDVYPIVADMLGKKPKAIARCIERSANLCWEMLLGRDLTNQYLGAQIED